MPLNWSVTTSPRSPYKIRNELTILSEFEGRKWDKRTQSAFARALVESHSFEGEAPATLDWVGRARFGTIKFWGFAFKDSRDKLRITEAGRRLITGKREDEIFLKQLLKWQYPDNQHRGSEYSASVFSLHPFLATLKVLQKVEHLTKDEAALFLFALTKDTEVDNVSKEILAFRDRVSKTKGRVPKKELLVQVSRSKFLKVFPEKMRKLLGSEKQVTLFESDHEKLRGSVVRKIDEFVYRKVSTFHDYADALFRYLRYTQLLTVDGHIPTLRISPVAKEKVKRVAQMEIEIVPYEDVDEFYKYYGDSEKPRLPYESTQEFKPIVEEWKKTVEGLAARLEQVAPSTPIPKIEIPEKLPEDLEGLKNLEESLRQQMRDLRKAILSIELQSRTKLREVASYYDEIIKSKVIDPPTFLEWNTWRAFESLDRAQQIQPNFKFSDDMLPSSPAGGNLPDIEVYYDDFVLVAEVTLKNGAVQWRDEAEPVPVHVIAVQKKHSDKPVIGLFLAPKIDDRTKNVFYACKSVPDMFGEKVDVIPLTIAQFRDILEFFAKTYFKPGLLMALLEKLDDSRGNFEKRERDKGVAWVNDFPLVIANWKKETLAERDKLV